MTRALLLNASGQPLLVIPDTRMVTLYMDDKVWPVVYSEKVFRSQHLKVAVPSVATLKKYVDMPEKHRSILLTTRAVLARDNHICAYCSGVADTMDHVIPRAKGGRHVWSNVTASCRTCNSKKRDHLLEEVAWEVSSWGSRKTRIDRPMPTPHGVAAYLLAMKPEPEWEPFLAVA